MQEKGYYSHVFRSQVVRKIITAITGLSLVGFIIVHLLGNLLLLVEGDAFNQYAHTLENMGIMLYIAEIILALVFLLHAYIGLSIYFKKRKTRPIRYEKYKSRGQKSKVNISSKTMALSGFVIFVFVIIHIRMFKFGNTELIDVNGVVMRDLKTLVVSSFQDPIITFGYVFVMLLLGLHLRHGIWSAFISLTVRHPKYVYWIYIIGIISASLIAIGFIYLPLHFYLGS